jgi:hypothetical protein
MYNSSNIKNKIKMSESQFIPVSGSIGTEKRLDDNSVYLIDFTKIQSVNDLVLILASVGFSFSPHHPQFENIKQFLALDNPIPINQPINTESK